MKKVSKTKFKIKPIKSEPKISLEEESAKRSKRKNLQRMILGTVAITGLVGIALLAPNMIWAMKKMGILPRFREKELILRSRDRLIKKGFLKYDKGMIRITDSGRRFLMKETLFEKLKDSKNKKWDGKWRVLIFDIPEKRKTDREHIRHILISIGFMYLQKSVWIYPYDCEDLITLLKADLKIGKDVLYMIVDTLEYDKPVKKYFNL